MNITVYSFKGGVGKTPIAVSLALDLGFNIATNEDASILADLFPDKNIIQTSLTDPFPKVKNTIFDLGGAVDKHGRSIVSALQQSDLVIVPISPEYKAMMRGRDTIANVSQFSKNILVVITKLKTARNEKLNTSLGASARWRVSTQFEQVQNQISECFDFPLNFFPLKYSDAYDAIFDNDKSIQQIAQENPLLKHAYRDVLEQLEDLKKTIRSLARD